MKEDSPELHFCHIEENIKRIQETLSLSPKSQKESDSAKEKFLSIHLQSNRIENFKRFLDNLENTADNLNSFEVIVKIDDDAYDMNRLLERESIRRNFTIKYISTPLRGGFFELWSSMNDLLNLSDPHVYFFVNFNDEMYFKTKGWDTILKKYIGFFPDDVFRLRTSRFRYRNYYDFWECGFAPETSAITSRKWLEIGGNWNPCLGPDSFQQCVAYYFGYHERFHTDRFIREIPIDDILIGGEGAGRGLQGEALETWMRGAIKAWYRLMSYKIQTEASRRARKLYAYVWAKHHDVDDGFKLIDDKKNQTIQIQDRNGIKLRKEFSYKLNRLKLMTDNFIRFFSYYNYGGAGNELKMSKWKCFLKMMEYRFSLITSLNHLQTRFTHGENVAKEKKAHLVKYIQLSVVWTIYTNQAHRIINPTLFLEKLINRFIKESVHLSVEIHPAYLVLRVQFPCDVTIKSIIEKIRSYGNAILKQIRKHPEIDEAANCLKIISRDDYYLYSDRTIETNALKSWEALAQSRETMIKDPTTNT